MRVLWVDSPRTSADVVEALAPHTDWKPNTVKTLLARLVKKGAVTSAKDNREHRYSPQFTEAQCARAEGKSFLKRVYGGGMMPMIANFLEQENLTPTEIAELRRLLDEKDKGQ